MEKNHLMRQVELETIPYVDPKTNLRQQTGQIDLGGCGTLVDWVWSNSTGRPRICWNCEELGT